MSSLPSPEAVEGTLVRIKPNKGLLVLSVELLRSSVAVAVDGTLAVPVSIWRGR
jgi:hypothetical protein